MKLMHAGLVLGFSTAARMGANLAIVKVIAWYLGTDGMGLLGQFMSVVALTTAIAGGGTSMGLTKYVAEDGAAGGGGLRHVRAAVAIWLATSALFFAVAALGAAAFSQALFGTPKYAAVFWGVAVAQFAIGAANILQAVLNGRHDVKAVAAVSTAGAIAGAALTCAFVVGAGFEGAMWGLILAPCIALAFAAAAVRRRRYLHGLSRSPAAGAAEYRQLLAYSSMLAVTVCTVPLTQIVLRTWQAEALGWPAAGVWQGLVKLSDAWLQFANVVLANYYFPRLARATDRAALHGEVKLTFGAAAAALVPAAIIIWLLRDLAIRLLFAPSFLPMESLLAPQLAGDVCRVLAYVIGYVGMARAQTRLYIAAELYQAGMLLLLSHFLIPLAGARGVPYAYCLTYVVYLAICVAVYLRWHRREEAGA